MAIKQARGYALKRVRHEGKPGKGWSPGIGEDFVKNLRGEL
jgi:hypothetical protein